MADEIRYVFDRKQLESQLGNTLDRPTLLLNKTFVRNTTTEDEVLNEGAGYNYECEEVQQFSNRNYAMQNCMDMAYNKADFFGSMPAGPPHYQQQ